MLSFSSSLTIIREYFIEFRYFFKWSRRPVFYIVRCLLATSHNVVQHWVITNTHTHAETHKTMYGCSTLPKKHCTCKIQNGHQGAQKWLTGFGKTFNCMLLVIGPSHQLFLLPKNLKNPKWLQGVQKIGH